MPDEYWVSMSHSSAPAVSGLASPTGTTVTGTFGRPNAVSAVRRSDSTPVRSPSAMMAIVALDAGATVSAL